MGQERQPLGLKPKKIKFLISYPIFSKITSVDSKPRLKRLRIALKLLANIKNRQMPMNQSINDSKE